MVSLFIDISIGLIIGFILGCIIGLYFGTEIKNFCEKWFARRCENKELWETYLVNIEHYKLWKHRHATEGDFSPDAQSLLLQALGPLTTYVARTGKRKAASLLDQHMKFLNSGEMIPSKNDLPRDRLK